MQNSDPKGPLPDLFYLELSTDPLGFRATIPVGDNDQKRFVFPLTEEGACELVMTLLAQKSIANAVWPKVVAILQEAIRQNAEEEILKPAQEAK